MELTELCHELKNWFTIKQIFGTFTIENGRLTEDLGLLDDQYYRIVGSIFNDGVHQYPSEDLKDETFDGAIWAMAVPPSIIALLDEINSWENTYGTAILSPFSSESFGGYSYTKSIGSSGTGDSNSADYRTVFGSKLNKWRKI